MKSGDRKGRRIFRCIHFSVHPLRKQLWLIKAKIGSGSTGVAKKTKQVAKKTKRQDVVRKGKASIYDTFVLNKKKRFQLSC